MLLPFSTGAKTKTFFYIPIFIYTIYDIYINYHMMSRIAKYSQIDTRRYGIDSIGDTVRQSHPRGIWDKIDCISLRRIWYDVPMNYPSDDCQVWTGPQILRGTTPARVLWMEIHGREPRGKLKRACGTRGCVNPSHRIEATLGYRFWDKVSVAPVADCWNWIGSLNPSGYSQFGVGDSVLRGHRVVWEALRGDIPEGQIVRHKCDNRRCVNILHLELGTLKDNSRDMVRRGRCHRASISPEKAREIKHLLSEGGSVVEVSQATGASYGVVWNIAKGRTWRSV